MRAGAGIEIKGMEELRQKLGRMQESLRGQVMTTILAAAAEPVLDAAVAKCPVDTGTLKQSIKIKIEPPAKTGAKVSVVAGDGFYTGDQWYAGPVEFGHFTGKRKGRKGTNVEKYNAAQLAAGRKWVEPQPFMRPAADENKDRVLNIIQDEVLIAISEAAT